MFNLTNLNPSTKFYYLESDEWVELRLIPDSVNKSIMKELGIKSKQEFHPYKGKLQRVDSLDIDENKIESFNDKLNDYAIQNWHLLDQDNNEIPCTFENKKTMMYGSPVFSAWINKCRVELESKIVEIEEESLGNF